MLNELSRKKMKIKLLIAVTSILIANSAIAQSAFEGFYGQIASGYENNSYTSINKTEDENGVTAAGTGTSSNQSSSGMPLILGVGYNYGLSNKFLMGIGFDYSVLSQSTSNFPSTVTYPGSSFISNNESFKVTNRMNLFVTPSYVLSKDALVYLKAGYSMQQLQYTQGADLTSNIASGSTSSKNVNGYILGLGYKQMFMDGFYGFAEANYMDYGKTSISTTFITTETRRPTFTATSNLNLSTYNLLIGVGYKF
jgi:hypothetical protein